MAMQKIALACLLCAGHARRVQSPFRQIDEHNRTPEEAIAKLLLASSPAASFAYGSPVGRYATSSPNSAVSSPRVKHTVRMEEYEPSDKAITVGSAVLGGALGVQFTGELLPSIIASLVFAYLSTLSNGLGDATKSAGKFAANAYGKTLEINEEYGILPKVKGAVDSTLTVADNINKNYGITEGIDEKLALSAKYDDVKDKVSDLTGSVSSKIDDLKSKASSD
mmetsp:Transcript_35599/g.65289  ORF Transcript_35599/g.65289 Transcript_35599/m.65289 type:complete len:223 (+) Transcript_35599:100-768(+)